MKKKTAILAALCALSISTVSAYAADLLAFPGAVGGGKYTQGARAAGAGNIEVYHVKNLNESGSGSFAEAVSKPGRIIVFDVGGVIELTDTLKIQKSNLTILGQTAPGDGITFMGGNISINGDVHDIIMRHIRVRPTDEKMKEADALGGRWNKNIILDHCSMSWSVDEAMTLYAGYKYKDGKEYNRGSNLTVQNCITSESLRMSNHVKGAHGYGAIVGAIDSTWVNNLFAHHDSRSPRVDADVQSTDFKNNVIYNWGITNSAYGAQAGGSLDYSKNMENNPNNVYSTMNWENNYYKYGPGTKNSIRNKIFEVSNTDTKIAPYLKFYFAGNYVWGYDNITNSNKDGVKNYQHTASVGSRNDMGKYAYNAISAEEAYDYVLENAGATLPKRDAVDARIINDVKNHTGRIINNADEVGGWIEITETHREDEFTIPVEWLQKKGLSQYNETDIIKSGEFAGYTLIEAYVNDWTEQQAKPSNPMITVLSPATAAISNKINGYTVDNGNWTVVNDTEPVTYHAIATAVNGVDVTRMELYDRNVFLNKYTGNTINDNILLAPGEHYLTCRAYNEKGEMTQSTTSIVYVNSKAGAGDFKFKEIGNNKFAGKGAAWYDSSTGNYTVAGAGKLFGTGTAANAQGPELDSCGFMYKEVTGNFDIIVKTERIPKFENGQISGLMVRTGLEPDAAMWMIADGWLKLGENVRVISREDKDENSEVQYFTDQPNGNGTIINNDIKNYVYNYIDSTTGEQKSKEIKEYDTSEDAFKLPEYMRITRVGNTLTFYVSNSGKDWNDNTRQPFSIIYSQLPDTMYIGIATDSSQGTPTKEYFAQAQFSGLTINVEEDGEDEEEDDGTFKPVSKPTKWVFDDYVGKSFGDKALLGNYMFAHSGTSVSGSSKPINNVSYTTNLKLNGSAELDANKNPQTRALEILPAIDGMLEVAFAHASGSGDPRYMIVKQNGKEIVSQKVVANNTAYLSCKVEGGSPVYIYSATGGLNIYGVYYIPIEVSSPYVSFVAAGGKTNSNTFYQSHVRYEGKDLWQYGNDGEGKGGRTYGNTISTGFTSSVKTITGVSYDEITWKITLPVTGDGGATFIKIPSSKSVSGNALMLSDMIDPGENYIPDIDYKEGISEEIIIGEEMDPLDWGTLSEPSVDWEITDISVPSEKEINVSEESSFTEEQLLEFAEFDGITRGYNANSAWEVDIEVAGTAELSDAENVTTDKGAIYQVTSIEGDTNEAIIQYQCSIDMTISGESSVVVGLIIDNLYAPSASASATYN